MSQAGGNSSGGGGGGTVTTLDGNTGSATAVGGVINVIGQTDQLTTTGSGDTLTISYPTTGTKAFRPIVTQSGSNNFALTDSNTFQLCTSGSAMTLTIPLNSTVAFPVGTEIDVYQQGAGQVSIAATGGVTINSVFGNLKIANQYTGASLKKTATNTWELVGNLTA